jgi:hypothetical protein
MESVRRPGCSRCLDRTIPIVIGDLCLFNDFAEATEPDAAQNPAELDFSQIGYFAVVNCKKTVRHSITLKLSSRMKNE